MREKETEQEGKKHHGRGCSDSDGNLGNLSCQLVVRFPIGFPVPTATVTQKTEAIQQ